MRGNFIQVLACSVVFVGLIASCTELSQAESGGETFKSTCAACHGPDGKGTVRMGRILGAADLTAAGVQSQSDAQLIDVITNGKKKMPPFDGQLTKEQITGLVAYIRQLGKKD
ncbi:MAG: cytochrome c [Candidatus Sulfotelmatobacter sp.]